MNEIFNHPLFQLSGVLIQALSIGFGVGWGLKTFLKSITNKFELLEKRQEKIQKNQKYILKYLKELNEQI